MVIPMRKKNCSTNEKIYKNLGNPDNRKFTFPMEGPQKVPLRNLVSRVPGDLFRLTTSWLEKLFTETKIEPLVIWPQLFC